MVRLGLGTIKKKVSRQSSNKSENANIDNENNYSNVMNSDEPFRYVNPEFSTGHVTTGKINEQVSSLSENSTFSQKQVQVQQDRDEINFAYNNYYPSNSLVDYSYKCSDDRGKVEYQRVSSDGGTNSVPISPSLSIQNINSTSFSDPKNSMINNHSIIMENKLNGYNAEDNISIVYESFGDYNVLKLICYDIIPVVEKDEDVVIKISVSDDEFLKIIVVVKIMCLFFKYHLGINSFKYRLYASSRYLV